MSRTFEGAQLTQAHRLAQTGIAAQTTAAVLDTWDLLDVEDLDRTAPRWLRVVRPVLVDQHRKSARASAVYFKAFRAVELDTAERVPVTITLAAPVLEQLITSMRVQGPVRAKALVAAGVPQLRAMEKASVEMARTAARLALGGGRDTIDGAIRTDPKAIGWARVTSGNPCAFCAMLASRGPVYRSEDTAAGFEYHDGCFCTAEPTYSRDADWPAGSRELRDRWDAATEGASGTDALNAFRRSLAGG